MKKPALHYFAVCDGHGVHGDKCSDFAKQKLPKYIEQSDGKHITDILTQAYSTCHTNMTK